MKLFALTMLLALAFGAGAHAQSKLDCATAEYDPLLASLGRTPSTTLTPTTDTVPADSGAAFVMTMPARQGVDPSKLIYRVFISQPPELDYRTHKRIAGSGGLVAEPLAPYAVGPTPPDLAKRLGLEAGSSQMLQITIPENGGAFRVSELSALGLWRLRNVVAVACAADGSVQAWGQRQVTVSSWLPAELAAGALVLALYLMAVTVVWLDRLRTADDPPRAQPPRRFVPVKAWKWYRCLDPVVLTSDAFDRGNLSKLQILFFALIVAFDLAYLTLRTGTLSDLSPTIVYLLGIPALGTLGAHVAEVSKNRMSTGNWAWLVSKGVLPVNDPGRGLPPRWTDLIMSGSELDLYKLQALAFSVIVGFAMFETGLNSLTAFEVPANLLQILGLSQLVLVGGRLAAPKTLGDLDNLIDELRKRDAELRGAAGSGIDVDSAGKPIAGATAAAGAPFKTMKVAETKIPVAVQRYRDTAAEVEVLLDSLAHSVIDARPLTEPKL